jgi:putative PEP-CTERM system TPR-repeat lipoprotein
MNRSRWIAAFLLATSWSAPSWAADYLADAQKFLAAGDLRSAQIQLRNAVRSNPDDATVHYEMARVALQLGDAAAAEKEARKAQELGYDPAKAIDLLARVYSAQGRARDFLHDFPAGQGTTNAQVATLIGRGVAQLQLDQADEATASVAEAKRLAPQSADVLLAEAQLAIRRRDMAGAEEKVNAALAIDPKSPEALERRVAILTAKGDKAGALAAADQAVAAAPAQFGLRLQRAGLLVQAGQAARAKADVDAVLAVLPGSAQALYYQAVLLAEAQDFKGADDNLQKLSEFISHFPPAYLLQAVVKQHLGQMEQALDAATRYVARSPDDPRGAKLLAEIDLQMKRPDRAITALILFTGAGSKTKDPGIYDLIGRAYTATGRPREAVDSFTQAVALVPNDPGMFERLGASRLMAGDANGALEPLEHSLQLSPNQPRVEELLVAAALSAGKVDEAQASADRLAKLKEDPEALGNIAGLLKLARFDFTGARTAFEAVLKDHPDSISARWNLAKVANQEGNPDEELRQLAQILQHNPGNEQAVLGAVTTLLSQGKTKEALAILEQAHTAAPTNVGFAVRLGGLAIRTGDPKRALALTEPPADGAATPLPLLLLRAEAQAALKQPGDAETTYRQILTAEPAASSVRLQLAGLLVADSNIDAARTVLEAGLQLEPKNYPLMQALTVVDTKNGGVDAGLAGAAKLQQDPAHLPAALPLAGDLYMQARRFDEAVVAYSAAMKTTPSTLLLMRIAVAQTSAGHGDRVPQLLHDWLAEHPHDVTAAEALAELEIRDKHLSDAKGHLQLVLAERPNDPTALNNLAWIGQVQGDKDARPMAERAYHMAPSPQTADTLGYIMVTGGDVAAGTALLQMATLQAPNDASIKFHLAVALKNAGKTEEAAKLLGPVVAAPADFAEKPQARQLLTDLTAKR